MSYPNTHLTLMMIAFNFGVYQGKAQTLDIDSTKVLYSDFLKLKSDTSKIKALIHLGDYILRKPGESRQQIDSGMFFLNQGIVLAKKNHAIGLEMNAHRTAGINLYQNKDTTGGEIALRPAAKYYENSGTLKEQAEFWFAYGDVLDQHSRDDKRTIAYLGKAERLFLKLNMKSQAVTAENRIALVYLRVGKIDEAISRFLNLEKAYFAAGNYKDLNVCQRNLADLYWRKGNSQQTLYYNLEALKSAEKCNNKYDIFFVNMNLASLYYNLKRYDKSLAFTESAYRYTMEIKDQRNFHTILLSIIHIRVMLHQTKGLLDVVKKGEQALPPDLESRQASFSQAYGFAYDAAGNVDKAEKSFLRSMVLFDIAQKKHQYENTVGIFIRAFNRSIGDFHLKHKKFKQARPYFETVLRLPKNVITTNTEIEVRSALFRIDSASGDHLSALNHFRIKTQLHDSLFNAKAVRDIAELDTKYETDQRLKDIKLLKSQRDAQQLASQKIILQRNITFGGVAGLLIIAGMFYAGFRNKKLVNQRLQLQQAQINQQNYSLQRLLSEKEVLLTEKDWLLKEVHHRVKNNLQIIMSLLNSQSVFTEDAAALEAINISRDRVQAISLIHKKLSNENNMATVNIKSYVAELVDYLSDGFGTTKQKITFKQFIAPLEINIAQAVSIALILNEAITNSIKYAFLNDGGEITLTLEPEADGMILLRITDNGKGFNTGYDANVPSLGFNIMKGLTAQLKGDFRLEDASGIRIAIKFRLKAPI
jgi:two-component sensor histidine kinase